MQGACRLRIMKEFRRYFIFKELKSLFSFIWCHLYTVDIKCLKYYIKKLLLKSNFGQLGILNIWWETNLICYFWIKAVLISVSLGNWDCVIFSWFWFYSSVTIFDYKKNTFLIRQLQWNLFFLIHFDYIKPKKLQFTRRNNIKILSLNF